MSARTKFAIAALLLFASNPILAKKYAGLTDAERRTVAIEYSTCLAEQHHLLLREFVLSQGVNDKKDDRYRVLSKFECIPARYKSDLTVMRMPLSGSLYAAAEALLIKEKPAISVDFSSIPYLAHREPMKMENYKKGGRLSREEYEREVERTKGSALVSRIGECTVRGDTPNVVAMLATQIGSDEEKNAIQTLIPVISRCITDGSIKLLPELIRGTAALNLYRLVNADKASNIGGAA